MVRVIFDSLPDLDRVQIKAIGGIEIPGSKTAERVAADYPHMFSIQQYRYGNKLTMATNWGCPAVELTYTTDGTDAITIQAVDKTEGDEHSFVGGRRPHGHPHIIISW